jgi:hypothetical protein
MIGDQASSGAVDLLDDQHLIPRILDLEDMLEWRSLDQFAPLR